MYESMYGLAERVRFELTDACASTVFKLYASKRGASTGLTAASVGPPGLATKSMYESMYRGPGA